MPRKYLSQPKATRVGGCAVLGAPHLRRGGTRDKANLDITWPRDESLEDMDNLSAPEVIAQEMVEDLTADPGRGIWQRDC